MQLSEEQIILAQVPAQGYKFNLKFDSTHGNNAYSNEPLISSPQNSKQGSFSNRCFDDDDESKHNDYSDVETSENISVVITLETSVHSRDNCESKCDDDSSQSSPQPQVEEEKVDDKVKEQATIRRSSLKDSSKSELPNLTSSMKRRKSCLLVRTQEESLTKGSVTCSEKGVRVSFNKLSIREYQIQLVNNPACTAGPPIGIGWNYTEVEDVDLNELVDKEKKYLQLDDRKPGPYDNLYLKPYDRLAMLKKNGYSDADIVECILEVKETQSKRTQSATANEKDEKKVEMVNKVTKKFKKLIRSKEQKKQDKMCKSFYQQ